MNLSMIPAELDPRIVRKLDREAEDARRALADAVAAEASNYASYDKAFGAWKVANDKLLAAEDRRRMSAAVKEKEARLARALDSAFARALDSRTARLNAQRRADELENPALVAQIARREQEKRERLDDLNARRAADLEADRNATDTAATKIVAAKPRRDYPQVVDNGDGLAGLDRESLRILCRENGASVAGHKAVVVERLRALGVTP